MSCRSVWRHSHRAGIFYAMNRTQRSFVATVPLTLLAFSAIFLSACPDEPVDPLAPALVLLDQLADPPAVVAAQKVTAPGAGWLAVYQDLDGGLGPLLGRTAVGKGERENVPVQLSRPVIHNETLHFRLLQDLGEQAVFEAELDTPYLRGTTPVGGSIEVTLPLISSASNVRVVDQTCEPANVVVVASALSLGRGWVAILDDNGGKPNGVIGYAALADGPNKNVLVTLERDVKYQEPLHAAVHIDVGQEGIWESDIDIRAVTSAGADITDTFIGTLAIIVPVLNVEDQSIESDEPNVVRVFDVVSDGPGIVVVRAGGSQAGNVIGWTAVNGNDGDEDITLDRDLIHNESLWAGLYRDTNDNDTWDDGTDGPLQANLESTPQQGTFVVRSLPTVTADDQTASPPNQVVVASALSSNGGFVAIFDTASNVPIGTASLASGTQTDVAVTLSRDAVNGEVLTATLYEDTDSNGNFDIAIDQAEDDDGEVSDDFTVYLSVTPTLTATDTSATVITSRFAIGAITSDGPGWVAAYEDAAGSPGPIIGYVAIAAGDSTDVLFTADRPLVDGEMIHLELRQDVSPVGTWDAVTDIPQMAAGTPVTGTITVTVAADLPDGRIVFANNGAASYDAYLQEPAWLDAVSGAAENQSLTLTAGWRYEIFNEALGAHPMAILDATSAELLSQDSVGSLEADVDINYVEDGAAIRFTVAPSLATTISRYVCTIHAGMTAPITIE